MKLKKISNLLLFIIYVLNFFYNYLEILPYSIKWSLDIVILIILFTLSENKNTPKNIVFRYYRNFTILIIFAIILSAIYNNSNVLLTIATIRKTLLPFILFYIFYSITFIYKEETYIKTFLNIIYLQIILVPIEYLLYLYYSDFHNFLKITVPYNKYDIAVGSFGGGGTGVLGTFLVLFFVYSNVYLDKKYSYLFLVPLVFTFSGGANLLFVIAMFFILVFTTKTITDKMINVFYLVMFFSVAIIVSDYIFNGNLLDSTYYAFEKFYEYSFEDKGETFGNSEQKLSRIGGFSYVIEKLNTTGNMIIGLGPDAVNRSLTLGVESYKLGSISDIKSDILFRLIQSGFLGVIINYIFYLFTLLYFVKRLKYSKYYVSGTIIIILFIISTFYIQTLNCLPIMAFMGAFLGSSVIKK